MNNNNNPNQNQLPLEILSLGLQLAGYGQPAMSIRTQIRRFREMYGCDPIVVQAIWEDLRHHVSPGTKIDHLFWALFFLKKYPTDGDMGTKFQKNPTTIRRWVWTVIFGLQELKATKIHFPNDGWEMTFTVSVDCTDCPIEEPRPFDRKWFSQKSKSAGVKYEVAIDVLTGNVVWVNGPFKASKSDVTIFREGLKNLLPEGKLVVGDKALRGEPESASVPNHLDHPDVAELKKRIRARQETFFARVKTFKVFREKFRHKPVMDMHQACFEAVAVVVQYGIENGSPLFRI